LVVIVESFVVSLEFLFRAVILRVFKQFREVLPEQVLGLTLLVVKLFHVNVDLLHVEDLGLEVGMGRLGNEVSVHFIVGGFHPLIII